MKEVCPLNSFPLNINSTTPITANLSYLNLVRLPKLISLRSCVLHSYYSSFLSTLIKLPFIFLALLNYFYSAGDSNSPFMYEIHIRNLILLFCALAIFISIFVMRAMFLEHTRIMVMTKSNITK